MRSTNRFQIGVSLFFIGLACACSNSPKDRSNTLSVQLANEPISLDPLLAEDGVSLQVLGNLHQGLVGYDGEGKLQNRLAETVSISADGKKYEFILKKNLKWSDGRPIEVKDFLTAFERVLSPQSRSKLAYFFFPIRGAVAFHEKRAEFREVGIHGFTDHLVIELERPIPSFIHSLTLPPALPVREDILKSNQGIWPELGPVTGPYQLKSHQMNQKLVLERNPSYWGVPAKIEKVEFKVVVDETTGLNLFDHGDLDILERIPNQDIARLKKQGQLHFDPYFGTYYLSFNCRKPPFDNKNWRKAVAGAIQRKEIALMLEGSGQAAWSWVPMGIEGFLPYRDPKAVFSNAIAWGRSQVSLQKEISASFDSSSRNSQIMEKVQNDIQKTLGLSIVLNHLDWKTYFKTLQTDPPSIFRSGWLAPTRDPLAHLKAFTTNNLNNYSGWSNAQYDALVHEIEGMSEGERRKRKIHDAQKILLEDEAALVPIYHYVQNTAVSSRVRNFRINPFGVILFQELSLEDLSK